MATRVKLIQSLARTMRTLRARAAPALVFVAVVGAGPGGAVSEESLEYTFTSERESVVEETFSARDGSRYYRMEMAPEHTGALVELEIASPFEVDLDLLIFDRDPRSFKTYRGPICRSDGVGGLETCRLHGKGPESYWIVVSAVEGQGATSFRLSVQFFGEGEVLLRLGDSVELGRDRQSFWFQLSAGELATVVLEGSTRELSVFRRGGEAALGGEPFAVQQTRPDRSHVSLGDRLEGSQWLLRGVEEPMSYRVEVEQRPRRGFGVSTLSLVAPESGARFLVPFSMGDVKSADPGRKKWYWKDGVSGRVKDRPLAFEIQDSEYGYARLDQRGGVVLALCDDLGQVLQISPEGVEVDVGYSPRGAREPRGRYLVVLRDPYEREGAGYFRLQIVDSLGVFK